MLLRWASATQAASDDLQNRESDIVVAATSKESVLEPMLVIETHGRIERKHILGTRSVRIKHLTFLHLTKNKSGAIGSGVLQSHSVREAFVLCHSSKDPAASIQIDGWLFCGDKGQTRQ